ncbi:hypothetical protein GCM10008905_10810 [Clostridium malenominatum]|uniref:Transposase n=1 Tax=Clostridium malenominatum TaxID=1539 RepID=A0ABP3U122_9CLOT
MRYYEKKIIEEIKKVSNLLKKPIKAVRIYKNLTAFIVTFFIDNFTFHNYNLCTLRNSIK